MKDILFEATPLLLLSLRVVCSECRICYSQGGRVGIGPRDDEVERT